MIIAEAKDCIMKRLTTASHSKIYTKDSTKKDTSMSRILLVKRLLKNVLYQQSLTVQALSMNHLDAWLLSTQNDTAFENFIFSETALSQGDSVTASTDFLEPSSILPIDYLPADIMENPCFALNTPCNWSWLDDTKTSGNSNHEAIVSTDTYVCGANSTLLPESYELLSHTSIPLGNEDSLMMDTISPLSGLIGEDQIGFNPWSYVPEALCDVTVTRKRSASEWIEPQLEAMPEPKKVKAGKEEAFQVENHSCLPMSLSGSSFHPHMHFSHIDTSSSQSAGPICPTSPTSRSVGPVLLIV
ncbi:hypothetical protein BDF14DRAFT_1812025 [Spinellus fusiger]|nr:hypothetical protein BDF14DRAFT_1812025 [Spinellus fusiger]